MYLYYIALIWALCMVMVGLFAASILADLVHNKPKSAILGTLLAMVPAFVAGSAHMYLRFAFS